MVPFSWACIQNVGWQMALVQISITLAEVKYAYWACRSHAAGEQNRYGGACERNRDSFRIIFKVRFGAVPRAAAAGRSGLCCLGRCRRLGTHRTEHWRVYDTVSLGDAAQLVIPFVGAVVSSAERVRFDSPTRQPRWVICQRCRLPA